MVSLDKTEKEMILLLQKDGRMSFVDMAKSIGVTEGTVRRKFNRLVSEGILRIAAVADPFKVGFETPAVIGLKVEAARLDEVIDRVSALPQIRYVFVCTGEHDVVAEGYFASNQELSRFIMEDLARIPGIRDITTSLLLKICKQSFTWGVADHRPYEEQTAVPANL